MVLLDGEEYLTGEEAAALLGVKRETLYAYVSRGMLKSYRQGIKRQRLYRRSEIDALVRLAPSTEVDATSTGGRGRPAAEVPLAESWIRE
ncbi:MAG TPA: helix-turn-helix domain-containing protein [Methylomirabilota bacterium]|nr:helix-turn-helix domain-containing protein [Methylomirabilota bacterium]